MTERDGQQFNLLNYIIWYTVHIGIHINATNGSFNYINNPHRLIFTTYVNMKKMILCCCWSCFRHLYHNVITLLLTWFQSTNWNLYDEITICFIILIFNHLYFHEEKKTGIHWIHYISEMNGDFELMDFHNECFSFSRNEELLVSF